MEREGKYESRCLMVRLLSFFLNFFGNLKESPIKRVFWIESGLS